MEHIFLTLSSVWIQGKLFDFVFMMIRGKRNYFRWSDLVSVRWFKCDLGDRDFVNVGIRLLKSILLVWRRGFDFLLGPECLSNEWGFFLNLVWTVLIISDFIWIFREFNLNGLFLMKWLQEGPTGVYSWRMVVHTWRLMEAAWRWVVVWLIVGEWAGWDFRIAVFPALGDSMAKILGEFAVGLVSLTVWLVELGYKLILFDGWVDGVSDADFERFHWKDGVLTGFALLLRFVFIILLKTGGNWLSTCILIFNYLSKLPTAILHYLIFKAMTDLILSHRRTYRILFFPDSLIIWLIRLEFCNHSLVFQSFFAHELFHLVHWGTDAELGLWLKLVDVLWLRGDLLAGLVQRLVELCLLGLECLGWVWWGIGDFEALWGTFWWKWLVIDWGGGSWVGFDGLAIFWTHLSA